MINVVDKESLQKLKQHQEIELSTCIEKGRKWVQHKEDYDNLMTRLEGLCDQTQHQVMIPIGGKRAFMPGQLVHTNEIMVLLGDNWFADRSVKQAKEICQRRIEKCTTMINDLKTEKSLIESWKRETDRLETDTSGNVDIREPYDESEEIKWREEHKQRMKKYKQQETRTQNAVGEEDKEEELWKRLDELEVEEELDDYLTKEEEEEEEEEKDWSESPELTDDEEEDDDEDDDVAENSLRDDSKRKVSFGDVTLLTASSIPENENPIEISASQKPQNIIEISHTNCDNESLNSDNLTPGHLKAIFYPSNEKTTKSILKESSYVERRSPTIIEERDNKSSSVVREPFVEPINETVIERTTNQRDIDSISRTRKVSRFKMARSQK